MIKRVKTVALNGMDGILIEIEIDISNNLPYFEIIGMADASVKEASQRVKRAIINSGFVYPKGKITANLSPAYINKRGSHFDLGLAVGVLLANGNIESEVEQRLFVGELSLGGEILPAKGVLPMIMQVVSDSSTGIKEIILPEDNCAECYLLTKEKNVRLIPARNLKEVARHLRGEWLDEYSGNEYTHINEGFNLDYQDVKGQVIAKEAIMIAIAGNHNLLLIGPPGSGKTMLARRVPTILPQMTLDEKIQTTKIYSYAGKLPNGRNIINQRPFRHVTSNITTAALIGGGSTAMPGEVSFAHNGVLFLDEMLEFSPKVLEQLRVPISEKEINVVRKNKNVIFPSNFILIGATNPCRCGFLGDSNQMCTCSQTEIVKYRNKLSGPLADRIDMAIEISRVNYKELEDIDITSQSLSSKEMMDIIVKVKDIQKRRFESSQYTSNGDIDNKDIKKFCELDSSGHAFMKSLYDNQKLSPRRYHKILKIARTIADIKGLENIGIENLATAFHYTRFLMDRSKDE